MYIYIYIYVQTSCHELHCCWNLTGCISCICCSYCFLQNMILGEKGGTQSRWYLPFPDHSIIPNKACTQSESACPTKQLAPLKAWIKMIVF